MKCVAFAVLYLGEVWIQFSIKLRFNRNNKFLIPDTPVLVLTFRLYSQI